MVHSLMVCLFSMSQAKRRKIKAVSLWVYIIIWKCQKNDPSINTPIYSPIGGGCLHKSQIFKQNWMISIRSRFISFFVIWHDPTNPPTHAPTHRWGWTVFLWTVCGEINVLKRIYFTVHYLLWMDLYYVGGVFTNYKFSNKIEISQLGQDLFDFLWFDLTLPINPPNHPYTHP